VLEGGVSGEDRVVWLDDSGRDLRSWVDRELELGFLSIVDGKTFQEKSTETRTSTTTERVEDKETLESSAVICEFSNTVKDKVDNFLSNSVVTTGVVVGSVFLSSDELFWVEELSVSSSSDFVNDSWFQVNKDSSWNVFASTSL